MGMLMLIRTISHLPRSSSTVISSGSMLSGRMQSADSVFIRFIISIWTSWRNILADVDQMNIKGSDAVLAPCKGCINRHVGCHSVCRRYSEYKEKRTKELEQKNKATAKRFVIERKFR